MLAMAAALNFLGENTLPPVTGPSRPRPPTAVSPSGHAQANPPVLTGTSPPLPTHDQHLRRASGPRRDRGGGPAPVRVLVFAQSAVVPHQGAAILAGGDRLGEGPKRRFTRAARREVRALGEARCRGSSTPPGRQSLGAPRAGCAERPVRQVLRLAPRGSSRPGRLGLGGV